MWFWFGEKKCRRADILNWAFIRGLRLDPPHPLAHALEPLLGQRRSEQSRVWPSFQGLLLTCSWKSQGNPPSTPAPVICPSMCQSSRTRWQAHDDMAIVLFPLCCLDISNQRKRPSDYGISVSSGMLGLARTFEIYNGETTCLWALQTLLGKVEVFGTQVFNGIR